MRHGARVEKQAGLLDLQRGVAVEHLQRPLPDQVQLADARLPFQRIDAAKRAGVEHLRTLSAPLGRSYESAIKLYNHAEWAAAAITMRHFLDGLGKRLLASDKREMPLTRQLEALAKDVDLARPLQNVAQLLAPNGAIGHRFEDEATIDQEVAAQLIELTEGLVSYLVVLPAMLADIKARIGSAPVPMRRDDVVEMRPRG